jgi:hypothetical protein
MLREGKEGWAVEGQYSRRSWLESRLVNFGGGKSPGNIVSEVDRPSSQ